MNKRTSRPNDDTPADPRELPPPCDSLRDHRRPTLYRCAGANCPGLPYRASDIGHPASCCDPQPTDVPATLTREDARARLMALGHSSTFADALLNVAHRVVQQNPFRETRVDILRAFVAGVDSERVATAHDFGLDVPHAAPARVSVDDAVDGVIKASTALGPVVEKRALAFHHAVLRLLSAIAQAQAAERAAHPAVVVTADASTEARARAAMATAMIADALTEAGIEARGPDDTLLARVQRMIADANEQATKLERASVRIREMHGTIAQTSRNASALASEAEARGAALLECREDLARVRAINAQAEKVRDENESLRQQLAKERERRATLLAAKRNYRCPLGEPMTVEVDEAAWRAFFDEEQRS